MMAAAREIAVQGEIRYDEPMSRHTSWRAGGPAEIFFIPASVEDLASFSPSLMPKHRFSGMALAATCWCVMAGSPVW